MMLSRQFNNTTLCHKDTWMYHILQSLDASRTHIQKMRCNPLTHNTYAICSIPPIYSTVGLGTFYDIYLMYRKIFRDDSKINNEKWTIMLSELKRERDEKVHLPHITVVVMGVCNK